MALPRILAVLLRMKGVSHKTLASLEFILPQPSDEHVDGVDLLDLLELHLDGTFVRA